jgi:phosphatidylglycerophosphatase A
MRFARLVASGFGSGLAPFAPGTAGSLAALAIGALLLAWSPWALLAGCLLAGIGGFWAVRSLHLEGDPGWVVIDEFAGQFIALLGLAAPTPLGLLAAFLLFRLLDIAKPGPVGWADRQPGAAGIMCDDILAGLGVGATLWAAGRAFPALLW